jgi:hypothetical protein
MALGRGSVRPMPEPEPPQAVMLEVATSTVAPLVPPEIPGYTIEPIVPREFSRR